jgi:hypothetical protein
MKLEFQSRWLRVMVEFLEPWPPFRRYRVVPPGLETPTRRWLRRQIIRRMTELHRDLL